MQSFKFPYSRYATQLINVIIFPLFVFSLLYSLLFIFPEQLLAQNCFTREGVAVDNRCLYIMDRKVYEKGTREAPHQGHPCGTDVTSIIPSFHTEIMDIYLSPNFRADICAVTPEPEITLLPTNEILSTLQPEPTQVQNEDELLPVFREISNADSDLSSYEKMFLLGYNTILQCYGSKISSPECSDPKSGDIDNDGQITSIDYNLILIGFNKINQQKLQLGEMEQFKISTPSSETQSAASISAKMKSSLQNKPSTAVTHLYVNGIWVTKFAAGGSIVSIIIAFAVTFYMNINLLRRKKLHHSVRQK